MDLFKKVFETYFQKSLLAQHSFSKLTAIDDNYDRNRETGFQNICFSIDTIYIKLAREIEREIHTNTRTKNSFNI